MYFYVSWYPGDPLYPSHDSDCSILVSITSVARDWTIGNFPSLPSRLLIDSGGYRFAIAPQEALTPSQVLQRQLNLLDRLPIPTIICARDYPILDKSLSGSQKDRSITQTIAFAYEFKNLIEQKSIPSHVIPMAIIQGYDIDSFLYCAEELKAIGFPLYGLGSLAELRQHHPIIERVSAVTNIIPADHLHVFGVSGIRTIRSFKKLGIRSVDSARPAKAAAYNEILYSNPYRRFGILESPDTPMKGKISRQQRLKKPLSCECPVCMQDSEQIMVVGKRDNIRSRALHNYYHLKQIFCS